MPMNRRSAEEISGAELSKVHRKATRMFVPRIPRAEPTKNITPYAPPTKEDADPCIDCGRPKSYGGGLRCRECYQLHARAKFEAIVKAEKQRVARNEKAFYNLLKKGTFNMTKKDKQTPVSPIHRSTSGLRVALFEEMEALRNGSSNAQRARSVAMMANSILQSVQVEIEYHKYVSTNKGRVEGQPKVVELGTSIALDQQAA